MAIINRLMLQQLFFRVVFFVIPVILNCITATKVLGQKDTATHLSSIDFKDIILKFQDAYAQANNVHIDMMIDIYENESSKHPLYSVAAEIWKKENRYLYRYPEMEMMMSDKYLIMVDQTGKQIVVNERDVRSEEKFFQMPMQMNFDSLFSFLGTPKHVGQNGALEHFRLTVKNSDMRQVDFFIDTNKMQYQKLQYHYHDGQFVSIVFKTFQFNEHVDDDLFLETTYFSITDKTISPSKRFASFRIVTHDSETEHTN